MADEILTAKAEFNERINTNQEQAQALLDLEKENIECFLQEQSASSVRAWYHQIPEITFNPFQDEEPSEVIRYPCFNVLQDKTLHGKQLFKYLFHNLEQAIIPLIRQDHVNMNNNCRILGFTNNMLLSLRGFTDMRWYSSGFIKDKGYNIKIDEQPTYLCYWSFEYNNKPLSFGKVFQQLYHNERTADKILCKGSCYAAYNAEQILGLSSLEEDFPISLSIDEKMKKCEHIAGGMGVSISHEKDLAYDIGKDNIILPTHTLSLEKYCASLIHQLCYSTAHHERLNRCLSQWEEDLSCTLAAITICDHIQLNEQPDIDVKKIKEWSLKISEDNASIFNMMREVKRMIDYMMELCPDNLNKNLSEYDFSLPLQRRINEARERSNVNAK